MALSGPTAAAKSTLIRIIDGMVQPDSGEVELGETIKIGYFAQEVPDMDGNQRVIDYIRDVAEFISYKRRTDQCVYDAGEVFV